MTENIITIPPLPSDIRDLAIEKINTIQHMVEDLTDLLCLSEEETQATYNPQP
jgi:hypothetical protein